jgi:hypothetical protein
MVQARPVQEPQGVVAAAAAQLARQSAVALDPTMETVLVPWSAAGIGRTVVVSCVGSATLSGATAGADGLVKIWVGTPCSGAAGDVDGEVGTLGETGTEMPCLDGEGTNRDCAIEDRSKPLNEAATLASRLAL